MLDLSHKKLIAWQKAIELLPLLYSLCNELPPEEKYNLADQIKRAGISVSNNIAEGASRRSRAEKRRFFEIARSSLVETDNCLTVCVTLKFFSPEEAELVTIRMVELFKLITGLIDSNNN